MALRVLTTSWTLALLGERADPARVAPALGLVAQQALCCRDHLSLGSSANNHLIAEYAAMATFGAAFPAARDAAQLLARGLAGLERECLRQIHPDGVPAEQAFGYLPFVWELFLIPFAAAEAAGRDMPRAVKDRLRTSLEFARVIRLPDVPPHRDQAAGPVHRRVRPGQRVRDRGRIALQERVHLRDPGRDGWVLLQAALYLQGLPGPRRWPAAQPGRVRPGERRERVLQPVGTHGRSPLPAL